MKIYIPEEIPSGNKGEQAILEGIYQGLKDHDKDIRISVFSFHPEIDRINYSKKFKVVQGITFRPRSDKPSFIKVLDMFNIWVKHLSFWLLWSVLKDKCLYFFRGDNWKAYSESDVILVGHDGVLSDINLLFAIFVKGIGKKTAIFGCGFKKFRFRITEKLAPYIMSKIDLVILREKRSYNYLHSLGVPANKIDLKPDPAFLMKPANDSEIDKIFEREKLITDGKPLIGMIALRRSIHFNNFFENISDEEEKYWKLIEFFARMVEIIIGTTSGKVVFIPHSIGKSYKKDDRVCARDIKSKMEKNVEHVILIENEYDAMILKGFIQRLDFLVSQRLHAVIGAGSVGTPFLMVTVKEDGRAHNIVEDTIGRGDLLFDINNPTITDFVDKFERKWHQRYEIKEYLISKAEEIHGKCHEAANRLARLSLP